MPRSAAWMKRSCAIVRPDTRIVVCSRWSRVNVRGTSSNHCLAASVGSPRRLRSSISNCFSSASIASIDIESRLLPFFSFVVLILFSWPSVVLNYVAGGGALGFGFVGLVGSAPHGDLLGERLDLAVQLFVDAADRGELLLQRGHQL